MDEINTPKWVQLHCAATPDYEDGEPDRFSVRDVRRWHVEENGWDDVGYHYLIKRSGSVQIGRPIHYPPAGILGHNTDCIALCYFGTKRPTPHQWDQFMKLGKMWYQKYGIGPDKWIGHYELDPNKICPGIDMDNFRKSLTRYLFSQSEKAI